MASINAVGDVQVPEHDIAYPDRHTKEATHRRMTRWEPGGSGVGSEIRPGNSLPLENIPDGTLVHNIEMLPGQRGKLVRAAGTYAQVMAKEGGNVIIRLPSGEMRKLLKGCRHLNPSAEASKLESLFRFDEAMVEVGCGRRLDEAPALTEGQEDGTADLLGAALDTVADAAIQRRRQPTI